MNRVALTIAAALMFPVHAMGQQSGGADEAVYEAAKRTVIQQLKDPNSAQFGPLDRQTRANVRGEPMDVVCGKVNARNSYGGYTGMSGFVYFVSNQSVYFADGSGPVPSLGPTVYNRFCGIAP